MMEQLLPLRIARLHRTSSVRLRANDTEIAALLPCRSDGSDGKFGFRLACAYAHAEDANRICGRTCQCDRTMGRGQSMAALRRIGIVSESGDEMVPKRSVTKDGDKRQWQESRRSGHWCRSPTGEQSALSLNGPTPSTISKSISDGVSKCSSMLASDASGLRMGAAAPRLRRSIGCSRITSGSSAMAEQPSTQAMVNASAVPTTPARPRKPERAGDVLDKGGRGFNSLEGSVPVTAPTLIRRFFFGPRTFELFSRNQKFKLDRCDYRRQNNAALPSGPGLSSINFLTAAVGRIAIRKIVAKFPGGGGTP
jgi:hypothetical protein